MNYRIVSCALILAAGVIARADALNKQHVASDAKWLVHIDCDNLRQSKVGEYLFNKFVAPKLNEIGSSFDLDASNLVQRINSLTAYGTDFKKGPDANGVLLINADTDTQKVLEGALVAHMLANTNGPVKKVSGAEHPLYSFGGQVFIAPQKGGPIVISKSQERIDTERELLAGKGESLAAGKTLEALAPVSNSFFFVGVADALDLPNPLPAQANILKMAEGGRVALGEKADNVVLNVALRGKTAEVTQEIQQVIEGMIALVKISQKDNSEFMELAKSAKVSSNDQLINLSIEYPTTKVIARLDQELSDKPKKNKAPKAKAKGKNKQAPKAEEDTEPQQEPATESKTGL